MRYVTGALRLFLLLVFFLFALRNLDPASVRFYFDLEWRAPLILVLLTFFVLGVVVTLAALLPHLIRLRRGSGVAAVRAAPGTNGDAPASPAAGAPRDAVS